MDVEHIFRKPGTEWTDEEKAAVFEWLMHEMLDKLLRFAYGFTHTYRFGDGFELAKDIVASKIAGAFRYLHTYDPARAPDASQN